MRKILIVIDMQNDFIDGALGTGEAVSIVEAVKEKIRSYPSGDVMATMDTHGENYLETQEGFHSSPSLLSPQRKEFIAYLKQCGVGSID